MEDPQMLVLSRKARQSIVINGEITVTILSIRGDVIRLGIEAPKEVPVHRSELFDRLEQSGVACTAAA
jgi:carbon storage regulator